MCDFMAYVAFNKVTYKTWKGEKNFAECYCWRLQFKSSLPRKDWVWKKCLYMFVRLSLCMPKIVDIKKHSFLTSSSVLIRLDITTVLMSMAFFQAISNNKTSVMPNITCNNARKSCDWTKKMSIVIRQNFPSVRNKFLNLPIQSYGFQGANFHPYTMFELSVPLCMVFKKLCSLGWQDCS